MLAEATFLMEDAFRREPHDDEIIGESAALKDVWRQVEVVAPTDATVLLQGLNPATPEIWAKPALPLLTQSPDVVVAEGPQTRLRIYLRGRQM